MFSFTVGFVTVVCLFVFGDVAGLKVEHRRQIWGALQ